jgi:hypothetical protein
MISIIYINSQLIFRSLIKFLRFSRNKKILKEEEVYMIIKAKY